ncbi:MAG: hypothetical protein HY290_27790 [Planctomycetia bacterium]|nr:hypothetical protein [Planctomycetia bacterium]
MAKFLRLMAEWLGQVILGFIQLFLINDSLGGKVLKSRLRLAVVAFALLLSPVAAADGPAVRIALVGDSTVASYEQPPADRPDLTGWGQVFGEFFDGRVEVRNFAASGRSAKSFVAEGRWQPVLDAHPDYVFIQFGHNDQKEGDRFADPEKEFPDQLRKYIADARAARAVHVLVTPVARRTFENGKPATTLMPYAEAMRKVGRETHTPVIDLHAASFELYGRLGDDASADLSAAATDRTHFSRKGARAMAGLVVAGLPRALPQLIPFLKEHSAAAVPGLAPSELPGPIRLALPPVLYAVVGIETNVYFDNVVLALNPANYAFDVHCPKGRHQQERWTFTPLAADAGDHPFEIDVRNEQNEFISRGRSVLRVIPAARGEGKDASLLCIGDSLTHASVYPQRVLALCEKPSNPRLTLIGSHTLPNLPDKVRHEGYGGWTALRFATHATGTPRAGNYAQRASPFLYPGADGKPALDFGAYCRDVSGGKAPDFVTIFLGPNDIFSLNDATLEAGLATMLDHYDLLIGMVHKFSPSTRVGVMLPVPAAASQDAFGANYATGQTRWQYKRNQHRLVEWMLDRYGGRDSERIHLVPTHANLDCQHNYPTEESLWNADTPLKGLRQNNGVHPSDPGYDQIGNSLYAWIKANVE